MFGSAQWMESQSATTPPKLRHVIPTPRGELLRWANLRANPSSSKAADTYSVQRCSYGSHLYWDIGGSMTVHGVSDGFVTTLAAVFLGAGLFLTGCSSPSGPVLSTESPTATATAPPPAPAPPGPTEVARRSDPAIATDVYISATSIEVRDASGETLATFDYFQPASEVVAGLSTAFGGAPLTEAFESPNMHQPPGTSYTWDHAFPEDPGTDRALSEGGDFVLIDGDTAGTPPFYSNTSVLVSAEAVNGIHISTVDGIAVGDNTAEIAARYPYTAGPQGSRLDIFVGFVPLPPSDETPNPTFSVWLIAADPLGPITEFRTPSSNWGA